MWKKVGGIPGVKGDMTVIYIVPVKGLQNRHR